MTNNGLILSQRNVSVFALTNYNNRDTYPVYVISDIKQCYRRQVQAKALK